VTALVVSNIDPSADIVEVQTFFEQFGAVMQAKAGMHQNRHEVCAMLHIVIAQPVRLVLLLLFILFGLQVLSKCLWPKTDRAPWWTFSRPS
jgi:hypothetical protein